MDAPLFPGNDLFGFDTPDTAPENTGVAFPENSFFSNTFGEPEVEPEASTDSPYPESSPETVPEHGAYPETNPEVEPEGGGWMPSNPFFPEPGAEPGGEPGAEPGAEPGYPEVEPEGEPGVYPEPAVPLFSDKEGLPVYSTLAAVVATLIIVLNIAVLVVLARQPKQRKSLSYLIGLIATFDMIGGLQFLWFSSFDVHLMLTHQGMWIIVMCGIWMLTMAPQISAMVHFGLHLLNELQVGVNNAKFSLGRIIFIIVTVFALPIALFIPPLAGWNCIGCRTDEGPDDYCAKTCSMAIFPFTKIYVLLMVVLLFAAMLLVVSIYVAIYSIMCRKRCDRKLSPKSGNTSVIRVTTLLLVVYILFTIPVAVVMIFDFANWQYNPHIVTAFGATLFVSFLSNLINPIIVFSTLPAMRQASCGSGGGDGEAVEAQGAPPENGVNGNHAYENKVPIDGEDHQDTTKI